MARTDEDTACHGTLSLHAACLAAADALFQNERHDSIKLGLYVRKRCGLHGNTRPLGNTARLLTALLRRHFPGDAFLTVALLRDPRFDLHRDVQNEWLPNLVVELRQSDGGGTWVESETGHSALECGTTGTSNAFRWGVLLTGVYKFSARALLHCSMPGASPRIVLIAWTPAGWNSAPVAVMRELRQLGFVVPTVDQCARARLSTWSQHALVQSALTLSAFANQKCHYPRDAPWPAGVLRHQDAGGHPHGTAFVELEDDEADHTSQ